MLWLFNFADEIWVLNLKKIALKSNWTIRTNERKNTKIQNDHGVLVLALFMKLAANLYTPKLSIKSILMVGKFKMVILSSSIIGIPSIDF